MSMRRRCPRQSISKPPCTRPSRCMRAPTPASSSRSTQTCSSTPARMRPSTCSPVWRSMITASMPALARSWPSSRPEGPAPMMATWVRVATVSAGHGGVHPVAPLRVRRRRRGHEVEQRPRRVGLARARADCRREGRDDLDRRRQRPEHVDAFEVNQLGQLLEAELHIAARHQRAHRNSGRRRRRSDPRLRGDAPALEQSAEPRRRSGRSRSRSCAPPAPRAGAHRRCRSPGAARPRAPRPRRPSARGRPCCRRPRDPRSAACRSRRTRARRRRTARPPARARRRRPRLPIR